MIGVSTVSECNDQGVGIFFAGVFRWGYCFDSYNSKSRFPIFAFCYYTCILSIPKQSNKIKMLHLCRVLYP